MRNALIMGAAGRDFHNFNVFFRNNGNVSVRAFTAAQIPDIDDRRYPGALAGRRYPKGIPIFPEEQLGELIEKLAIDDVYFSYSDIPDEYVMQKAAVVMKAGASFVLLGPNDTMLKSRKPVISICAVRTGCGKSQTTRKVSLILKATGRKVAIVRHPMPYGDLVKQRVQKFAKLSDLKKHKCTIEEMEEYEPHIENGMSVYAGVDYGDILQAAEAEADVILWDGGNNDVPFYRSDLEIVVVDPHRPGHELTYYPGAVNFRRAEVIVINKIDSADLDDVLLVRENIRTHNPRAVVIDAASPISVEDGEKIRGKKVLVVEDGPTLTHGEMQYGAGVMAAYKYGAAELVDPRPYAVGTIRETFEKYPGIGTLLPAMGYGKRQMKDLETTINRTNAEVVVIGTPINLANIVKFRKPTVRVTYDLAEIGTPTLEQVLARKFKNKNRPAGRSRLEQS